MRAGCWLTMITLGGDGCAMRPLQATRSSWSRTRQVPGVDCIAVLLGLSRVAALSLKIRMAGFLALINSLGGFAGARRRAAQHNTVDADGVICQTRRISHYAYGRSLDDRLRPQKRCVFRISVSTFSQARNVIASWLHVSLATIDRPE